MTATKRRVSITFPSATPIHTTHLVAAQPSYMIVDAIRSQWRNWPVTPTNPFDDRQLGKIVPIHNRAGISSNGQIDEMTTKIKAGRLIFETDGTPNVKLVVTPDNQLLMFDGNHTLLAYLLCNYQTLSQIPYLVISAPDNGPVSPSEISAFFPKDGRLAVEKDWQKFVINWERPVGQQLELRQVATFGQLAKQFR